MQSKFSSPVKGLLPLFLIINIAVTALAIIAHSFYSQTEVKTAQPASSVNIVTLADRLDLPMVDAFTI